MANSRSARKRIRVNETKRIRNNGVRTAVRTKISKARRSVLSGEADGATMASELKNALKALDKAGEKGILHANNVRRRKSRLASMTAMILAADAGGVESAATEARTLAAGGQKGRTVVKPGGRKAAAVKPKAAAVKPKAAAVKPKAAPTKTGVKAVGKTTA